MINFTLRQLRYFEALARHGHFGRAADDCSISQPALSVQIRDLEESLGAELFERAARQVRLSAFGEEFLLRVREILRSVDELGDLARAHRRHLVGRLRIGVIPTVAPYLLPGMISALTRDNADLDIHVRETVTPKLLQELAEGRRGPPGHGDRRIAGLGTGDDRDASLRGKLCPGASERGC